VTDVIVVGAAIIEDGRLLAAQRIEPPEVAGWWEFPGGKVEAGESDEDALVRECREELGVEIEIRERVGRDWPMRADLVMRVWTARIVSGEARPLEDHSAIRWLGPDELYDVAWLPADLPVVAELPKYLERSSPP
jgi:8-oxo-dGTP diphosphatase